MDSVSIRRSNGVNDDGGIGAGRLLDSRTYPVFDPGGDAGRHGTGHDGLGSVAAATLAVGRNLVPLE